MTDRQPTLVLASASPRRSELLRALGLPFTVEPADLDEVEAGDLVEAARGLALDKARAVARRLAAPSDTPAVVLAADTIVAFDGESLGKPADAGAARAMLQQLCGGSHEVITGVAVVHRNREASEAVVSRVTMRDYADEEVEAFIESGEPFDKAGGYAIQHADFSPVAGLDGCECAVVGLPLWTARALLAAVGGLEATDPALDRCSRCPLRTPSGRSEP